MKNLINKIDWKKVNNLIPAIIQDVANNEVLMLGFMNQVALEKTLELKKVHFYSRTKKRLWMKGESSHNYLNLVDIKLDCDADTLLIKVNPISPTCHNGVYSCFGDNKSSITVLSDLFKLIQNRKQKMPSNSYTTSLFSEGVNQICAKIEEESLEVIQAAKKETKQRLIEESSDLLYHLFVLLADQSIELTEICDELIRRRN